LILHNQDGRHASSPRACVLYGPTLVCSAPSSIWRELTLIAISTLCKLHPLHPACQGMGMDRLKTYIDALRVLAKTHDPNRVVLIERNIDNYLKTESGGKERSLERLRVAVHNEEAERREGEDWSVAKEYVRSLLRRMT
jgi:hypothetical protein